MYWILFTIVCIISFVGGIIDGMTSKNKKKRKSSGSLLSLLLIPITIIGGISKCINDLARPQYGRHGRRSIAKRKRRKW